MSSESISARQLTTELEHGDASHVQDFFRGQFEDQRFSNLGQIRTLYQDDVKAGRTEANLDFKAEIYYNPSIEIDKDGWRLYGDTLDLYTMSHSDGSKVPEDRKPLDMALVRKVTTDLEDGDPKSLAAAQNGKFIEERTRFLKEITLQNNKDIDRDHSGQTVRLSCQYAGHKWFGNEMAVDYYAPGGFFSKNFWTNPQRIYSEVYDVKTGKRTTTLHPF
jgi:hypothetical protein